MLQFNKRFQVWMTCVIGASWIIAAPVAFLIRFDGEWKHTFIYTCVDLIVLGFVLNLAFTKLYSYKLLNNVKDITLLFAQIILEGLSVLLVLLLIRLTLDFPSVPRSIVLTTPVLAHFLQIALLVLFNRFRLMSEVPNLNRRNVIIYGAGSIGLQLAEQLLEYQNQFSLIGFVDDERSKMNSVYLGKRVIGGLGDIKKLIFIYKPNIIIVAIANIDIDKLLKLREESLKFNVEVKVVPSADEIISGMVTLSEIKTIDQIEMIGRTQTVSIDPLVIEFLRGRKALVTGAAGSIGSEIVKQLRKYNLAHIALLDRDENGLLRLKLELDTSSDLSDSDIYLGDIRDVAHIESIIEELRPDIVFHAAALKHVATLERFPEEAVKTNVHGTLNIWRSCLKTSTPFLVNISSDKAANPSTELGRTKLISERIIASTPNVPGIQKYVSVRFGNVIGSNGSFVETFRRQIERGGPVTVRHPEVTRYFMTVKEAVTLVLQSLIHGMHKETLVLDMGDPIKILDVANQMIKASGRQIEIVYSGLKPGEKLHESLVSPSEKVQSRGHPKIMHLNVEPLESVIE